MACAVSLVLVACCMIVVGRGLNRRKPGNRLSVGRHPVGVLPGEFERQEAILLAWPLALWWSPESGNATDSEGCADGLFAKIVRAVYPSIHTVVLVKDSRSEDRVAALLREAEVPPEAVWFVQAPFNTEWIRDYGPMGVRADDGSCTLIDAEFFEGYFVNLDPQEDRLPATLGTLFDLPVVRAPIALEHGNLLSNGQGLCITTQKLLEDNVARGYDAEDVTRVLKTCYGAKEVVFLETLRGETTGHVDMFATFPSPDTVVVGQCAAESDPVNAAILDRNAERLASLGAPCGPLNVVRIPMPKLWSADGLELWPTYTNVLYANDTLLVPVYPGLDMAAESTALALYRELLPGWTIVGIDAVPFLQRGGSIHCVTLNLASVGKVHRAVKELLESQTSMD